ncbi:MAG: hypothetical protein RQ751_07210 [Longimicrobiales bacterium]|nr:hypothetical protein [Longimicrobiales bacterium]
MVNGWHTQKPASQEGLPLKGKDYLKGYYAGLRLESPTGGILHPLRVRPDADGSGTVLFECSASSLRYELHIPRATRRDREKVREQQGVGQDPVCPRHVEPLEKLQRTGDHLVCPRCGVRYGKPA